jgi:hypothetical protein
MSDRQTDEERNDHIVMKIGTIRKKGTGRSEWCKSEGNWVCIEAVVVDNR